MHFNNEREPGWLFVDQQKVEGYGTGYIRIGAEPREVIGRCRDDVACPFLIPPQAGEAPVRLHGAQGAPLPGCAGNTDKDIQGTAR